MTPEEFHNGLRVLHSIDRHEMEAAGVIKPGSDGDAYWWRFRNLPSAFVVAIDDDRYQRLWSIIERRMNNGEQAS